MYLVTADEMREMDRRTIESFGIPGRVLMENAKRTATDFLVPPVMERAIKKHASGDSYQFWREFSAEEKF